MPYRKSLLYRLYCNNNNNDPFKLLRLGLRIINDMFNSNIIEAQQVLLRLGQRISAESPQEARSLNNK